MKSLERAAMFEALNGAIEEIDSIFAEYGFSPDDFDPENLEFADVPDLEIAKVYSHVHGLKEAVEWKKPGYPGFFLYHRCADCLGKYMSWTSLLYPASIITGRPW